MSVPDTKLRNAKFEGKRFSIAAGDSLILEVMAKRKVWRLRYRKPDTRKAAIFTIGNYPDISQPQARQLAEEAKLLLKQGIDPTEHRNVELQKRQQEALLKKQEAENSFKHVALAWHQQRVTQQKWSHNHADKILRSLELHVFPVIGDLNINDVTAPVLLDLLNALECDGKTEVVKKLNQRINAIFRYAVIRKLVKHNEADNLKDELTTHEVQHNPYLKPEQIPAFFDALNTCQSSEVLKIAVEFTMRTLARTGEVRFAKWSEFNMDNKLWDVPAERMKMKRRHLVPLPEQVIVLLNRLHKLTGQYEYLFPTYAKSKPMSENAMLNVLYRMGYKGVLTIHGLRGTGSTILNDSRFRSEVIEMALSHAKKDRVEGAYNHALYLPERKELLQWYSDYLDGLREGAQVIPINRKQV